MSIAVGVHQILGVFGEYLAGVAVVNSDGTKVKTITSSQGVPYDQWSDCLKQLGDLYSNYSGEDRSCSVDEIDETAFGALVKLFNIPGSYPIPQLKQELVDAMNLCLKRRLRDY